MLNLLAPLLIVESDIQIQQRLHALLLNLGYKSSDLIFTESISSTIGINLTNIAFAIIDLDLSDGNGLSIINALNTSDNKPPMLVLSSSHRETTIINAIQAGVTAYILKEREDFELLSAIRNVLQGGVVIDPFITKHIINLLPLCNKFTHFDQQIKEENNNICLTTRENEILKHIANGLSNQEIADQLYLSRYTIETHIRHIYRKLTVCNRTKAISKARKIGLI
ncbi:LuxR C-terminal-related transcriptional regulator [Testudinibacter sp. P80/BLE/0925]|uniref:LuxR C-terminal-related transcriptional regulator n=1 Tax=Testudinibacter sp. TW-1 TaxID=3417757 RepID=UPI003D363662